MNPVQTPLRKKSVRVRTHSNPIQNLIKTRSKAFEIAQCIAQKKIISSTRSTFINPQEPPTDIENHWEHFWVGYVGSSM